MAGGTAESFYAATINRAAAREGVDPRLVRAVIQVESAYQSNALSPKGAMGLMQLMPETARQYGVKNAYEPVANINAGVRHLRSLLERFPVDLAIAAYNAGEAAVERFDGIPPFRETQDYVVRVLQAVKDYGGNRLRPIRATAYSRSGSSPAGKPARRGSSSASSAEASLAVRLKAASGTWQPGQAIYDPTPSLRRTIKSPAPVPTD